MHMQTDIAFVPEHDMVQQQAMKEESKCMGFSSSFHLHAGMDCTGAGACNIDTWLCTCRKIHRDDYNGKQCFVKEADSS